MNLRSVDLNLLVALDALLAERHVSRAAARIGLSQPAMSNALGRLRHLFGDEILVRTATGMQPTPRAEALVEPTQQALRQVRRVLEADAGYEPKRSERRFALRLSDLLGLLFLPGLLARLASEAPKVALDVLHLPPAATVEALENDAIDLAISTGLEHAGAIDAAPLLPDRMVCLMRRGHPAAAGRRLTRAAFLRLRQVKVALSPADRRFVDAALGRAGGEGEVALNLPHWLMLPPLLRQSDLVAVTPARFAAALADRHLVALPLPFAAERFTWSLYWHRRHAASPANRWLREEIRALARTLA